MKHSSKDIGSILEHVLKNINADDIVAKKRIISQWDQLFDSKITKICHPVQFTKDDVLELEAISESWKKELMNVKFMILSELKTKFNGLKIKDIKII